jgi:hypothetical protein
MANVSELIGVMTTQIARAVQKQCALQQHQSTPCTAGTTQTTRVRDFFAENIHCSDDIVIGASLEAQQDKCCTVSVLAKTVVDSVAGAAQKNDVSTAKLLNGVLGTAYSEDEADSIVNKREYDKVVVGITNICGNGGGVMQSATLSDVLIANSDIECKHLRAAINESESTVSCIMGNGAATQKLHKQSPSMWEQVLSDGSKEDTTLTTIAIVLMAVVLAIFGVALIVLLFVRARRHRLSGQAELVVALDKAGNEALVV